MRKSSKHKKCLALFHPEKCSIQKTNEIYLIIEISKSMVNVTGFQVFYYIYIYFAICKYFPEVLS